MRRLTALATALLLAGPALAAPPPPNAFNDRMLKLSPVDQRAALGRAVTDTDLRCGRITASAYRGRYGNLGWWQARCAPGGDYAVFLGPDETAQVRPCNQMQALKMPACIAMKADAKTPGQAPRAAR